MAQVHVAELEYQPLPTDFSAVFSPPKSHQQLGIEVQLLHLVLGSPGVGPMPRCLLVLCSHLHTTMPVLPLWDYRPSFVY